MKKTLLFVLFGALHYIILASFFIEVATPMSLNIATASAITLSFVGLFGAIKGGLTTPGNDGIFYGSASVAAALIVFTGLLFAWALAHPVNDPPPLGRFVAVTIAENALWIITPLITVPAVAFAGLYIGRRLHSNGGRRNTIDGPRQ